MRSNSLLVLAVVGFSSALAPAWADPAASIAGSDPLASCREILSEWARIEQAEYEQIGSYRAVMSGVRDGRPRNAIFVISTKSRHKLMTVRGEEGIESVYARSPKYGFWIRRDKPNGDWLLVAFTDGQKEQELRDLEQTLVTTTGMPILYPLGTPFLDVRGSTFMDKYIKQVTQAAYEAETHRLVFAYDTGYHGTIETDPVHGNVITRVNATFEPGPSTRRVALTREFVPNLKRPDSALPLCKAVTYSAINDKVGGKVLLDLRIEFFDYSFDPPADDLFLLSHYGLPEPAGQPRPRP